MIEGTVFEHVRALHRKVLAVSSCSRTVSPPMQHPWGRSYRVVAWRFRHDVESLRRVVPAESTARQIAEAGMPHAPGRRFCQPGG